MKVECAPHKSQELLSCDRRIVNGQVAVLRRSLKYIVKNFVQLIDSSTIN